MGMYRELLRGLLVSAVILGLSVPTFAEIEEIVVTAQKREENLSEVPIAVSVLDAEAIEAQYANGLENLQALVPSLSFRKGNTTRNSALTVRGIGTISFSVAAEPSVSTVVDGVVLGRSGQAFGDLYELERVEVLRGPQGTLFGKNASAGVVNITTRRPTDDFEAVLDVSYFEDNESKIRGRISGPLADGAARGSLTLVKSDFDGYITNVFNNKDVQGYDHTGARGMLEYDIADDLSVLVIAEYYDADDDCCADLEGLPSGRNPASEAAPDSAGGTDIDLDQRRVDHDFETITTDENTAFSVQFDKGFGDYTLTSITAYRKWENTEFREGDFTSIAGDSDQPVFGVPFQLHDVGPQEWTQFSQELRLASPAGEQFEYQVGLFVWQLDSERNFTRDASCQNNAGQNDDILAANPGLTCNANDIVSATAFMETEFDNVAIFGQGSYHLTDDLSIFAGFRYTDDEVSFKHNRRSNDPFGRRGVGVRPATENTDFENDTDETNLSGKLGVQYAMGESHNFYGSYAQGYKGPAFNVFYNMNANGNDSLPIAEETSDAFEIGYKFASPNLRLNLAYFQTDIEDFQANNFDTSTGTTITRLTNAGDVETSGFEIDFLWAPTANLRLYGGAAFIDAEIDSFNCPLDPVTGTPPANCTSRSGLDVPFAPDTKYSISGDYVMPLDNSELIFNVSYVYVDEQQATLPGNDGSVNPVAELPDYDQINASVTWSMNEDRFRLSLIGKNLGDESYATTYSGDGFRYQIPRDADRYYGVNFRLNIF